MSSELFDLSSVPCRVKVGDTWRLGRHILHCGDSTVSRVITEDRIDLVFTTGDIGIEGLQRVYRSANYSLIAALVLPPSEKYKHLLDPVYDAPSNRVVPLIICSDLIDLMTKEGDTVYNPDAYSGSVLIACELTNRKCISVEKSPELCSYILMKFENLFNIKTEKVLSN